jgi:HPt (histidine-containing phosphotransfer) domain-containing protein
MTLGAPASLGYGMPGTDAIDRSVLGEWLDGDDAAIDALLAVFRDSISAEAVQLHELLALGDLEEFASAAHRLRGAALSMGARALADFAGLLFTAARAKDRNACVNGMPVLETHICLMNAEVPVCPPATGTPSSGI